MARSFLSRSVAILAFSCSFAVGVVADTFDRIASFVRTVAVNAVQAFEVNSPLHPGQAPEAEQSMGLVAAKAFKAASRAASSPR